MREILYIDAYNLIEFSPPLETRIVEIETALTNSSIGAVFGALAYMPLDPSIIIANLTLITSEFSPNGQSAFSG